MWKLFIECYTKKYFDFKGRASRKEYISFLLFNAVFNFLLTFIISIIFIIIQLLTSEKYTSVIQFILDMPSTFYKIFSIIPIFSLFTRRIHDNGYKLRIIMPLELIAIFLLFLYGATKNNALSILSLAISLCIILFIIFISIFKKGDPNPNSYGQPPTN